MPRYKSDILIPADLLEKWELMRLGSDSKEIASIASVSQQTVFNAFNNGKCQPRLFEIMKTFYEERHRHLNDVLGQA